MNQRTRERIALVAFVLVVAGGIAGGVWYNMNAGHQWNVAATRIDDAAGKMDDYSVIAFDGVAVPTAKEAAAEDVVSLPEVMASYRSKNADVMALDLVNPQKYAGGTLVDVGDKTVGVFYAASPMTNEQISEQVSSLKGQGADYTLCVAAASACVDANAAPARSQGGSSSRSAATTGASGSSGQQRSDQAASGEGPSTSDGGTPSASGASKAASSQSTAAPKGSTGIDVVVSLASEPDLSDGKTVDGTYFVCTPNVGRCGVVVISPYNVVSSNNLSKV